jgi:hypothetical protein
MGLFHRHGSQDANDADEATSFEVVDPDGKIVRYARGEFDEIVQTIDPDEVQRQVAHGWVILAERQVESPDSGPSGVDLLPGIEGLRVGGMFGYQRGESVTEYTIGYLRDGAQPDRPR